jgi:hypothetical protein
MLKEEIGTAPPELFRRAGEPPEKAVVCALSLIVRPTRKMGINNFYGTYNLEARAGYLHPAQCFAAALFAAPSGRPGQELFLCLQPK